MGRMGVEGGGIGDDMMVLVRLMSEGVGIKIGMVGGGSGSTCTVCVSLAIELMGGAKN